MAWLEAFGRTLPACRSRMVQVFLLAVFLVVMGLTRGGDRVAIVLLLISFVLLRRHGHLLPYLVQFLSLKRASSAFCHRQWTVPDYFEHCVDTLAFKQKHPRPFLQRCVRWMRGYNGVFGRLSGSGGYVPVRRSSHANSSKDTAICFEDVCYSFAELDACANQVAHWALRECVHAQAKLRSVRDSSDGDGKDGSPMDDIVVALVIGNCPLYIALWLGLAKAGIVAALVNPQLKGAPLVHCIAECNASSVIVANEHVKRVLQAIKESGKNGCNGQTASKSLQPLRIWTVAGEGLLHHEEDGRDAVEAVDMYRIAGVMGGEIRPGGLSRILSVSPLWSHLNAQVDVRPSRANGARRRRITPQSLLFYIFTSGTSGMPKAARISHLRFFNAGASFATFHRITAHDRIFCALPIHHSSAGMIGISMSWFTGAAVVLTRRFSARRFFETCAKQDCTVMLYIGQVCRYLLNSPPTWFDRAHCIEKAIGNGLRRDVWVQFQKRFGVPYIGEFYGSTEGNATLINNQNRVGAVGYIPWIAEFVYPVRIIKLDNAQEHPLRQEKTGFCVQCGIDEPGELIGIIRKGDPLRGFDGYSSEAATRAKVLNGAFKEGDRWFRTGDLVSRDSGGFIYFVDRLGDTFRWKGENVSTTEVEQVIGALPGVLDVCVYGVEVPGYDGRAGMATIVCDIPSRLAHGAESLERSGAAACKSKSEVRIDFTLAPGSDCAFDVDALYGHIQRDLLPCQQPLFLRLLSAEDSMDTEGSASNGGDGAKNQFSCVSSSHDSVKEGMNVTHTFKHKKRSMAALGFDPSQHASSCILLFRDDNRKFVSRAVGGASGSSVLPKESSSRSGGFVPLDGELYQYIVSGRVRL